MQRKAKTELRHSVPWTAHVYGVMAVINPTGSLSLPPSPSPLTVPTYHLTKTIPPVRYKSNGQSLPTFISFPINSIHSPPHYNQLAVLSFHLPASLSLLWIKRARVDKYPWPTINAEFRVLATALQPRFTRLFTPWIYFRILVMVLRSALTGAWRLSLTALSMCKFTQHRGTDGCMGTDRCAGLWRENLKQGDHLEDPDTDGRATPKRILKEQNGTARSGFITFGTASMATVVNTVGCHCR